MKYARRKFSLSLALALALLTLLPVLAVLQYKLLGQVSASERERMQANLKSSASKFSQDFDREIARAFLCFQTIPTVDGNSVWEGYSERYDRWLATSPYPQLVSSIFRAEATEGGGLHISEFDASSRRFNSCDWPEEFAELREGLERIADLFNGLHNQPSPSFRSLVINAQGANGQNRNISSTMGMVIRSVNGPLDEKIPALIIPVLSVGISNREAGAGPQGKFGTVIVRLDLDYIREKFIPELARQYFSADGGLEYKLAVLGSGDLQRVIYQSDADFPAGGDSSSDMTANLLALRMEDIENIATEGAAPSKGSQSPPVRDQIAVQVLSRGPSPLFHSLRTQSGEGQWEFVVKHRAGSLESVVAGARRRNLIISFGILLLLSASVVMIIISTRRAERLARQQMEFVAGVTHELRTPLAVIRSAGENLADGVIKESEQVRRYGSLIAGAGRRLTEMVEQALEFSGIQSGRRTYHLGPASVVDVISDAIAACKPLLTEGGFEIEREMEDNLPPIAADRAALSRAIQNLLSNAIKYSGASRRVSIKAGQSAGEHGFEVKITIEDRGIGIESEDLPHLFEPFYRGRAPLAAQIHGNGLGLALVKHIITAHGGRVTVESAPGRGSLFTLDLPAISRADEGALESENLKSPVTPRPPVAPRPTYE